MLIFVGLLFHLLSGEWSYAGCKKSQVSPTHVRVNRVQQAVKDGAVVVEGAEALAEAGPAEGIEVAEALSPTRPRGSSLRDRRPREVHFLDLSEVLREPVPLVDLSPLPPGLLGPDFPTERREGRGSLGHGATRTDVWLVNTEIGDLAMYEFDVCDTPRGQRQINELRVYRRLTGLPGVVQSVRVVQEENHIKHYMEYYPHGNLHWDSSRQERTFSPRQIFRVAKQVCSTLNGMHARSVVHRDLSWSNIFVKTLEPEIEVVVGDFDRSYVYEESNPFINSKYFEPAAMNNHFLHPRFLKSEFDFKDLAKQFRTDMKYDYWNFGTVIVTLFGGPAPWQGPKRELYRHTGSQAEVNEFIRNSLEDKDVSDESRAQLKALLECALDFDLNQECSFVDLCNELTVWPELASKEWTRSQSHLVDL